MNLSESIINQLTNQGIAGISKPQGFDLNDTAFSQILEKQLLQGVSQPAEGNQIAGMGAPAGFFIEPFNEISTINKASQKVYEPAEIKDVDMGDDYFSNLLKTNPKEHSQLMNFAKKHASNIYNFFGKNMVQDIADFAVDVAKKL